MTLNYSTSQINRDFLIKICGYTNDGFHVNTAVGVSGFVSFVGEEFANKFLARAYALKSGDMCRCCLRSGKRVYLYWK